MVDECVIVRCEVSAVPRSSGGSSGTCESAGDLAAFMRHEAHTRAARHGASVDCSDVTAHLWLFLDGELTIRETATIRRHLGGCDSCNEFVRYERAFLYVLRTALPRRSEESARCRAP
jgi:anti-sigma factor (TIGR02949 family)